jgi:small-conductance mechanosensitive channel
MHVSVLSVLKAGIVFSLLLLFGNWLANFLDKRLSVIDNLNPSTHVLLSKIIKIAVFFMVIVLALNSAGIDLTVFAVFSGAIGVGIGFGLQKVVGNFVSGIILLLDKSIKPGDVIQVGGVYGLISSLKGRYVSIITRDGKEYLIPNEDLITQQVINLSFSDRFVRFKIPFGVSYKSDPHLVIKLAASVFDDVARVLPEPKAKCLLKEFADSSINFELRFWVQDPENGRSNIKSEIMLKLWDILAANNIEIPFPQRDVNVHISDKTLQKMKNYENNA